MIGIGIWYQRKQTSVSEYVTANHGLSYWVSAFSARATGESGWLILGLTGMGFVSGLNGFWVILGEVLGVAVSWLIIIPRFKKDVKRTGSLTVIDFFEDRLGGKQAFLRMVFGVVVLSMVVFYLAAQIIATGKAFNSFYDVDIRTAEIVATGIVLLYVALGGFRAVAISDLIQGSLMVIGLVAVPVVGIIHAGGISVIAEHISQVKPELFNFLPGGMLTTAAVLTIIGLAGPGLGYLGSPQIYQRIIALDKEENIKKGSIVAILFTVFADTGAVAAGMVGRFYFDTLADAETVYPQLIETIFTPLFTGIFIAVILSAIMSTADSLLILASVTLVRDLYQKVFRPDVSEKKVLLYLKLVTVAVAVLGLGIALIEVQMIYWMVLFAWAGIAAAFGPPLIMLLFWKGTSRLGVIWGAIAGFLTVIVWKLTLADVIYEMPPAFLVSFVAVFVVSWFFPDERID